MMIKKYFYNDNFYKKIIKKKKDLNVLKKLKVNFVYIPNKKDIYSFKRKKAIVLKKENKILCAKFRKGHFEGVVDVMDRLTNIIKPNKIFMPPMKTSHRWNKTQI